MEIIILVGVGGLQGLYRSTNLLLRDVIELYPDLLLGRRRVMMREGDDELLICLEVDKLNLS